jgi:hypothetical protein
METLYEYTCHKCGKPFITKQDPKQAEEQFKREFPGFPLLLTVEVCPDCYVLAKENVKRN